MPDLLISALHHALNQAVFLHLNHSIYTIDPAITFETIFSDIPHAIPSEQ